MDMLKRVLAVLGVALGSLALFYLFFARSLILKDFGLGVEVQLIPQRILTPLLFVALGALAVSCEYFRRVLLQSGIKAGILLRILRLVAVVVLPAVIFLFTLKTPFWSFKSPMCWDRPRFIYGWFLPWKGEPAITGLHLLCPFLNLFLWTLYLMVLMGYRRIKHYLVLLVVMLVLFGLYAKFVGIKTVYRGRGRPIADSQCASPTPSYPSNAFSNFAEVPVCLKPRFPTAKVFCDLRSLDKMVVNLTTCTKRAKSFSRVATFAKASASAKATADETAAEEHVERGDDI